MPYIPVYFVATLFIMAMMISCRSFNNGDRKSFRSSLSAASKYWNKAPEWTFLYSVLLMILRLIEPMVNGIGGILIGAIGSFAITVATFFAIPSMIMIPD